MSRGKGKEVSGLGHVSCTLESPQGRGAGSHHSPPALPIINSITQLNFLLLFCFLLLILPLANPSNLMVKTHIRQQSCLD